MSLKPKQKQTNKQKNKKSNLHYTKKQQHEFAVDLGEFLPPPLFLLPFNNLIFNATQNLIISF
jgi:hypothetical protein